MDGYSQKHVKNHKNVFFEDFSICTQGKEFRFLKAKVKAGFCETSYIDN